MMMRMFVMLLCVFSLSACGGGGSSTPKTTTVNGSVAIPDSSTSVVAKSVAKTVSDSTVAIEAFTLNGVKVASATPTYDDSATQRIYSYSLSGLPANADYIIKVTKGNVVLKKMIEKKDMVSGVLTGMSIDAVSTTAVALASMKLGVALGDPLPSGKTIDAISSIISTTIKPTILEGTIAAAVNGGLSNLTSANAGYANAYNIVVVASKNNINPGAVLAGTTPLPFPVPIITVPNGSPSASSAVITNNTLTAISTTITAYTPPTESAATYNGLAKSYLAAQDISNASLNYEKALTIDPADKEANFGGAITSGMMLIEDQDVRTVVTKWGVVLPTVNQVVQGTSPIKIPFANMTSIRLAKTTAKSTAMTTTASAGSISNALAAFSALQSKLPQQKTGFKSVAKQLNLLPTTAPTVNEMQTLIDNVIIPKINLILARLAKVEGKGFTFTVTKSMQGNPVYGSDIVLNDGEFYTLDAALNIFQIIFKFVTAYNFDLPAGYTYDTISQDTLALINNPTFFTLKSGGAAKMSAALDNAKSAAAKAESAFSAVKVRAAGVGAFDVSGWSSLEITDFESNLTSIKNALTGAVTYVYTDGTSTKSINVDITKFFTNPLTKAKLPTFGYDVPRNPTLSVKYGSPVAGERNLPYYYQNPVGPISSALVPKSDLPDYSLNGILPGNTAANNVAEFNGILPNLDGKLLSDPNVSAYNVTTDGVAIYSLGQGQSTWNGTGYSYSYNIKRIDVSTGVVTTSTFTGTSSGNSLFYYNGSFYLTSGNTFYKISGSTVAATPTFTLNIPNTGYAYYNQSAITANGTDIYSVRSAWDYMTGTQSSQVWKSSNLNTPVLLFSFSGDSSGIYVSNNYLYTFDRNWLQQRTIANPGTVVANYMQSGEVALGGYFYAVSEGKLVKWAGTPTGGSAAKMTEILGKFF